MTRVLESWIFTPVELDFLWETLGAGELPYPLTLRSHGRTMDERSALRARTMAALAERNIVSMDRRLASEVEDVLMVLANADVGLDLIFVPELGAEAVGVYAGRRGGDAVLAMADERGLAVRDIGPDAMIAEVLGVLPGVARGSEHSVSLPAAQFTPGRVLGSGAGTESEKQSRAVARRLLAEPNLRGGQFGVSARTGLGAIRRAPVLAWLDKPSGRYLSYVRDGWQTMAPADARGLGQRLAELMTEVTAD